MLKHSNWEIPEHLIVIGGGYVGLELSQAMRRFGSDVSVIDRNNRLLHREDEDVSEGLRGLFDDEADRASAVTRYACLDDIVSCESLRC
jgi:pyruvate/2-oxoglutarate dehydrogenase complex dihydrolipoamide dehydrogenase (E3) component